MHHFSRLSIDKQSFAWLVFGLTLLLCGVGSASANVVGKLSGELSVNQGSLSYSLGLPTPNGVHDMNPGLSLHYSERAPNGMVGPGFTLSASSAITRCTPTVEKDGFQSGIQNTAQTRFCHDGARLVATSGTNGASNTEYRLYDNNNVRYRSVGGSGNTPATWTVDTPSGYTLEFHRLGSTSDLHATWLLKTKTDHFGNVMTYVYDSGSVPRIRSISYSGYEVVFDYVDRLVPLRSYQAGVLIEDNQILDRITVNTPSEELLYFFDFTYEELSEPFAIQRLKSVTQCFAEDDASCLKPVVFDYRELPDASQVIDRVGQDLTLVIPSDAYSSSSRLVEKPSYSAADVNGDGHTDFCFYKLGVGIVCAIYENGSYNSPVAWTGNLGYSANEEDYAAYGLLNLMDLNLDGKADFCITDDTGIRCGLSTGSGFSVSGSGHWSTIINKKFSGATFSYVNSDEYIDVCGTDANKVYQCLAGSASAFGTTLFSFSDVSFFKQLNWTYTPTCPSAPCSTSSQEYKIDYPAPSLVDIDNDFDNDVCWVSQSSRAYVCKLAYTNSSNQLVYGSAVTRIDLSSLMDAPVVGTSTNLSSTDTNWRNASEQAIAKAKKLSAGFRLSNLNGDALPDVCYVVDSVYKCHINTGTGFNTATDWLDLSGIFSGFETDARNFKASTFRMVDRNLDGMTDLCLIHSEYEQCAYSNGSSFESLQNRLKIYPDIDVDNNEARIWTSFMHKLFGGQRTIFQFRSVRTGYGNLLEVPDLDNDGYPEFCYRSSQGGVVCSTMDNYGPTSLLTSVTDSYGLRSDIEYGQLVSDDLYDPAELVPTGFREQVSNQGVVASIITDTATVDSSSGDAHRNRIDYRYGGFLVSRDGELSGFASMSEIQSDRNIRNTTWFYTDNDLFGQHKESHTYIDGIKVKETFNEMHVSALGNGTRRLLLDETESRQYELDGTLFETVRTANTEFDTYGYPKIITTTKELGLDTVETITTTTYLHDTTNWLLGRPDYQSVAHTYDSATETRTVDYVYANGRLSRQILQPGANNALTTDYQNFNTLGYPERVQTLGVADYEGNTQTRWVTKTYDSLGRVLTETNSLNQTITYTYDSRCGGVETITDIAQRVTTISYNEFCQKESEDLPDSNLTSWRYEWASSEESSAYALPVGQQIDYHNPVVYKVTETRATGSSLGDQFNTVYYDAQGRAIRSIGTGFSSTSTDRQVRSDTVYNQYGYRTAVTAPYYVYDEEDSTPRWTSFTFDDIGRVDTESKTGPDGNPLTVNFSYDGASTEIAYSDYVKTTVMGVHGQPSSVTENGLEVAYEYYPAGSLKNTVTGGSLTVSVTYDSRGFKIGQSDPSMGNWEYRHNAFGELVYQKDAKLQIVRTYYDLLGRLSSRISPEGSSSWAYYTSGNGIGQLQTETGTEATKTWTYDALGRAYTETLAVDSKSFTTTYHYDAFSRLTETIQPNNVSLFQRYDNTGKLQNVAMKARDFNDVDFEFLAAERDELLIELERLVTLQQAALERAEYHSQKALEYLEQSQYFKGRLNEVNSTITTLNDAARAHQQKADQYISLYHQMLQKANEIRARFGSGHSYARSGEDSENYYYSRRYCVSKHGWGPTKYCAKYRTDTIPVAKSDLIITDANNNQQIIPAPSTINPETFFKNLSEKYQSLHVNELKLVETIVGTAQQGGLTTRTVTQLDNEILDLVFQIINLEVKITRRTWYFCENPFSEYSCSMDFYGTNAELQQLNQQMDLLKQTLALKVVAAHTKADERDFINNNLLAKIDLNSWDALTNQFTGVCDLSSLFFKDPYFLFQPLYAWGRSDKELDALRGQKFYGQNEQGLFVEKRDVFYQKSEINGRITNLVYWTMYLDRLESKLASQYSWQTPKMCSDGVTVPMINGKISEHKQWLINQLNVPVVNDADRKHYKQVERIEQEQRLIPIMVGDITTFVPAIVPVTYIDTVEITIDEAKVYYAQQRDHYFALMQQEQALSAAAIDSLETNNIDDDLAVVESRLAAIDESLQAIDVDDIDALAQSQQQLSQSNGRLTLWHAAKRTAEGHLKSEVFGNGLYTTRDLNPDTGLVETIRTGVVNGETIRELTYSYDARGRITDKTDTNDHGNTTAETFLYNDPQGRLSDWTFSQTIFADEETQNFSLTHEYEHDDLGNLEEKTDAGVMTYDPVTNRLLTRTFNNVSHSYGYDSNGNMRTGDGRTYDWTSFNKARRVTGSGKTVDYRYSASHQQVMKTADGETRYYINPGYERVERGGQIIHRYTVWSGNDAVAVLEKTEQAAASTDADAQIQAAKYADSISYIHRDILGSGELITDSRMQVVARRYYSPYGRLIDDLLAEQKAAYGGELAENAVLVEGEGDIGAEVMTAFDQTTAGDTLLSRYIAGNRMTDLSGVRGFTSHESIEEVGLINMNARLYDPLTGRFVSADSIIPDLTTPLDYNRYAYVRGNPVVSRDPTGHNPLYIALAIFAYGTTHYGDNPHWQMAGQAALMAATMNPATGLFDAALNAGMTSLTMSYLQDGRIGRKSLENALISAASAGLTYSIAPGGDINGLLGLGDDWVKLTVTHMISQGVIADLRGDKFISGAVSGLIGKIGEKIMPSGMDTFSSTVFVATMGGLGAAATGGDFLNGAMSAAIVHLYNDLSHGEKKTQFRSPGGKEQIDIVFRFAKATNPDMDFGDGYSVYDFGGDTNGMVIMPGGFSDMIIDAKFLGVLDMGDMVWLLDTIIHEGLHITYSFTENVRLGFDHDQIVEEARERTQLLRESFEGHIMSVYQ